MLKKRILPVLLCLCMAVGTLLAITLTARAEDAYLWPVPAGKTLSRGYSNGHTALDITSGGAGTNVLATKSGAVVITYTGCGNFNAWGTGRSCSTATCAFRNNWYDQYDSKMTFCNWGYGNGVIIRHSDGSGYSMYAHMSRVDVSQGATVNQGDVLGTMGSAGKSTGPHLHFELCSNVSIRGTYYDPAGYSINNNIGNITYVDQITPSHPTAPVQNLGDDFYAYIYNPHSDCNVENRSYNVQIAAKISYDPRQIWHFSRQNDGSYTIRNMYDGLYLDVSWAKYEQGTNIQAAPTNGNPDNPAQKWLVCGDGVNYYLTPMLSNTHQYVLDIVDAGTAPGTNVWISSNIYEGSDTVRDPGSPFAWAQTFRIQKIADINRVLSYDLGPDFYASIDYIGCYLGTTGVITEDGYNMDVQTNNRLNAGDPKQVWHFIRQNDGSYKIVNESNEWCLDVSSSAADGVRVRTWRLDNDTLPQRWYFMHSPGDRTYRIASALLFPDPIYSLDVPVSAAGSPAPNGTTMTICSWHQNSNQQFTITPLAYARPAAPAAPTGIEMDNSSGSTVIRWSPVPESSLYDSRQYIVLLYDANGTLLLSRTTAENSCGVGYRLAEGSYRVTVQAINAKYAGGCSNRVSALSVQDVELTEKPALSKPTIISCALYEKTTIVAISDPDNLLGNAAFIYAAAYAGGGRMSGLVRGELTGSQIVFSKKLGPDWTIFLLGADFTPIGEKMSLK